MKEKNIKTTAKMLYRNVYTFSVSFSLWTTNVKIIFNKPKDTRQENLC